MKKHSPLFSFIVLNRFPLCDDGLESPRSYFGVRPNARVSQEHENLTWILILCGEGGRPVLCGWNLQKEESPGLCGLSTHGNTATEQYMLSDG
jgi:hypothetical protein